MIDNSMFEDNTVGIESSIKKTKRGGLKQVKMKRLFQQFFDKEGKQIEDWEIQMNEEQKEREELQKNRVLGIQMKYEYINQLSEAMESKDKWALKLLFVEWGIKVGFKNEQLCNWAERDYINLARTIYNNWLQLQPGCKSRIRTSKMRRAKLGFEKQEPTKNDIKEQQRITEVISRLILKSNKK